MNSLTSKTTRKIVHIDEEKCDGCGECVPNCVEGALRIIDGKARLVADKLCDGMGMCLGHCPRGAITIEERPAEGFDEHAVEQHARMASPQPAAPPHHHGGGCPGSRMQMLRQPAAAACPTSEDHVSRLTHWPVQLALLPTGGRIWENAHVLIAADCVPFAYPDFHEKLLAGKSLAIACPKLDDVEPYVEKLAAIFANNNIRSITVAHMEVPCCMGIVRAVQAAMAQAGARYRWRKWSSGWMARDMNKCAASALTGGCAAVIPPVRALAAQTADIPADRRVRRGSASSSARISVCRIV